MKALYVYVYESEMAMLGRVAGSYVGAELFLEHRSLGVLSGMKVYDMKPRKIFGHHTGGAFFAIAW